MLGNVHFCIVLSHGLLLMFLPSKTYSHCGVVHSKRSTNTFSGVNSKRCSRHSPTLFRRFYDRGDLPISIRFSGKGNKIAWKVDIMSIDYHLLLPLFFEGLAEDAYPYAFIAREGKPFIFAKFVIRAQITSGKWTSEDSPGSSTTYSSNQEGT